MTIPNSVRCAWAESDPLLMRYHDEQWGVPIHDDRLLFEMINLEGAQAGLSWLTILRKRDQYREAFDHFDAAKIVNYDSAKIDALMQNAGIVRNRLKINAVIENAKAFLKIRQEFTSFDAYLWQFVNGKVLTNAQSSQAITISEQMSKDLKKRGFKFVGPTICYAFMQSIGLINDHVPECFRAGMLASD